MNNNLPSPVASLYPYSCHPDLRRPAAAAVNRSLASSYTWDADPVTDGVQDGLGAWTTATTSTNWLASGTAPNVTWVQGSDAVFGGGTAGTAAFPSR